MADWRLAGNGRPCPDCGGRRQVAVQIAASLAPARCASCGGLGRVPIPPEEIVSAQLAENAKGPR